MKNLPKLRRGTHTMPTKSNTIRLGWAALLSMLLIASGCAPTGNGVGRQMMIVNLKGMVSRLNDPAIRHLAEGVPPAQRGMLRRHADAIQPIIRKGLKQAEDATGLAMVAAYLDMRETVPLLQERLLAEEHFFGGEGLNYERNPAFLNDTQYPRQIKYIEAIEELTGRPIHQAIQLSGSEKKSLEAAAANALTTQPTEKPPDFEAFRALWLLNKLYPGKYY